MCAYFCMHLMERATHAANVRAALRAARGASVASNDNGIDQLRLHEQETLINARIHLTQQELQHRRGATLAYECGQRKELGVRLASDIPMLFHLRDRAVCCGRLDPALRPFYYFIGLNRSCSGTPRLLPAAQVEAAYQQVRDYARPPRIWEPPPYAGFFATEPMLRIERSLRKPLLIICNKLDFKEFEASPFANMPHKARLSAAQPLNAEARAGWDNLDRASNFISTAALDQIVSHLYGSYTLVYYRFCCEGLGRPVDWDDRRSAQYASQLDDKFMLRRKYPLVHLVEDYTGNSSLRAHNLWLLSIASICKRFITVQGGTSYMFAYFAETHLVQGGYGPGSEHGFRQLKLFSGEKRSPRLHRARTNRELIELARRLF